MLSKTQSSAVSVEWPVRYADCSGLKLPDESREYSGLISLLSEEGRPNNNKMNTGSVPDPIVTYN